MLKVEYISIHSDITYERVQIALPQELEQLGIYPVFGEHTLAFKYAGKWHVCHNWTLKIIHISFKIINLPGIPYEKIIIDSDKVYGPGIFIPNSVVIANDLPDFFSQPEAEVLFTAPTGTYLTSDYAIGTLILQPKAENQTPRVANAAAAAQVFAESVRATHTDLAAFAPYLWDGSAKPCRSGPRPHNNRVVTRES